MPRSLYTSSPFHPDTVNWQTRVNAAGGRIAQKTILHTDRLIKYCYAVGLRDTAGVNHKLKFWLPLATDTFEGLFIPVWHPIQNSICGNNNFASEDYNLANGLQGNGIDKYIDSLVNASIFADSIYLAAHSSVDGTANSYAIAASDTSVPVVSSLIIRWGNGFTYFDYGDVNSIAVSAPDALGFFAGFRTAGQNYLYQNTTQLATNPVVPNPPTLPNINFYLFSSNNNGQLFGVSARRLCCFFMGNDVTPEQHEKFAAQNMIWHMATRS